jgi:hypothetical protein
MVAFLLDGIRAGFITAANLVVDSGMTRKMIARNSRLPLLGKAWKIYIVHSSQGDS